MWMLTEIVALNTSAQTYYTPWFERQADNANFSMELVVNSIPSSPGPFTVTVWTKNREDEGSSPGTAVGTFSSIDGGALGMFEASCVGLKQLVRFQITFRAGAASHGVVYRFLPPTWFDTAVIP
jgi:hypothetical protein